MGPQAVAEHYEEIILSAHLAVCESSSSRREASDECSPLGTGSTKGRARRAAAFSLSACEQVVGAAWLCVCALEPLHLLRLEARGAPVRALSADPRYRTFDAAHDTVLVGGAWATSYQVPTKLDVHRALTALLAHRTSATSGACAEPLSGPIVQDAPSMLSAFVPAARVAWSPASHHTFPLQARERARELLWLGAALARSPRGLSLDLWLGVVMALVLERRSSPGGLGEAGKPHLAIERLVSLVI